MSRAAKYLEDFSVGDVVEGGALRVDAAEIKEFAAKYDPQPFHLDEAAAEKSFFKGFAASGWHTAALTMRLIVDSGLPISGGVIGAGGTIAWPKALRPGSTIRLTSEVLEVRPSKSRPDRGMVKVRFTTRDDAGDTVQVLVADLVCLRRPG
jgi:acyl dehydratase